MTEKQLSYHRKYRIKNKDKINARNREFRKNNPEKVLEYRREYERINKDKLKKQKQDYFKRTNYSSSPVRKAYALAHRKEMDFAAFKSKLRKFYNITLDDYNNMMCVQNNRCAICGIHQDDCYRRFDIDHDHNTGIVRGLLCYNCNSGIGKLKENIDVLYNAIFYLENRSVKN